VIYSRSTITNDGPEQHHSVTRITEWQRGDRMHNVMTVTETVDHFERLPVTDANLALLDAPAIDAAQH
jgi:hypothetical protein